MLSQTQSMISESLPIKLHGSEGNYSGSGKVPRGRKPVGVRTRNRLDAGLLLKRHFVDNGNNMQVSSNILDQPVY